MATPEVSSAEIESARAMLHPDDHAGFDFLRSTPDATVALIRPFIEPGPAAIDQMMDACAMELKMHPDRANWENARVRAAGYVGTAVFETRPMAMAVNDTAMEGVHPFALAVRMCNALPDTATEPATGTVTKPYTTSSNKRLFWLTVGVAGEAVVAEQNIAENTAYEAIGRTRPDPDVEWVRARLAVAHRTAAHVPLPVARLAGCVDLALHRGAPVQLDRVRLLALRPGATLYRTVRR